MAGPKKHGCYRCNKHTSAIVQVVFAACRKLYCPKCYLRMKRLKEVKGQVMPSSRQVV